MGCWFVITISPFMWKLLRSEPLFVKLVFENDVVSILGHYQLTLMMWNSLQTTVESLKEVNSMGDLRDYKYFLMVNR